MKATPDLAKGWWERTGVLLVIAFATAIPLLWPQIPPLVDLPGHIGRYRVELDVQSSPELQRFYDFRWALIGNLGVDLLVVPLAKLFGLEPAVKLIVALIPPVTTLGIFAVAREVHGRVPPMALFAVPFVYGYSFNYGFVNFSLSVGLALLAFALWLRLSRPGRLRFRALLFVPLSCALWLVHVFGWGLLGLLAFSAEVVRLRDQGASWLSAVGEAALQMLPLSLPFVLMAVWRSGDVGGETKLYFLLGWKLKAIISALRDRWLIWDALGVAVALVVIVAGVFEKRLRYSRKLLIPALLLAAVFFALPYTFFGSANADSRLAPFVLIAFVIAVRFRERDRKAESLVAALGLAFLICRIVGNGWSFVIADSEQRKITQALNQVPRGAKVLTLASGHCDDIWEAARHWHLGALVISRKYGFSNDQWQLPGAQLLSVKHKAAVPFHDSKSVMIFSTECARSLKGRGFDGVRTTQESLEQFPRAGFDYVWLIKPPPSSFVVPSDLRLIWSTNQSSLYRVAVSR